MNLWLAGGLGVVIGGLLGVLLAWLLPMLFFMVLGFGAFGPVDGPMTSPSRVDVAADGSVSGEALAQALMDSGWYEDMTCPATPKVATDVTAICTGTDGFMDLRVVVVFRGDSGSFSVADLFE